MQKKTQKKQEGGKNLFTALYSSLIGYGSLESSWCHHKYADFLPTLNKYGGEIILTQKWLLKISRNI